MSGFDKFNFRSFSDNPGRDGIFSHLPGFKKTGTKWGFRILVGIVLLIIIGFFTITLLS